jgi:O-antigen ligase
MRIAMPQLAGRAWDRAGTTSIVVVTTLVAAYATFGANGSDYFELLPFRVSYDVIAGVALLTWLLGAVVRPSWRPASRMMPAILICLTAFAISTITSRNVRLSAEMSGYAVLIAGMYLLVVALMRRPRLRAHFERLGLLLAFAICVLYLAQVGQQWVTWWGLLGHFAIPPLRPGYVGFLYPDPIATVALILGAFALAVMPRAGRRTLIAGGLVVVLVLATTFVSGSRGAWLGLAAGVLATCAVSVIVDRSWLIRIRSVLGGRRGAAALVIMIVAGGAVLGATALSGRLNISGQDARLSFWAASLRMFQTAPLTGVGPAVWPTLRASYTVPAQLDYYIPHAHDIYIQALAEFGLLAIPAAVGVFLWLGRLLSRTLRTGAQPHRRVAYAAVFAVVLLGVQQVVDLLVNVPAVLLAIALPFAWLDAMALGAPEPIRPTTQTRLVPALGAMLVVVILVGLAGIEAAASTASAGAAAANAGSWSSAEDAYAAAAMSDPHMTAYRFELGLMAANAGNLAVAETALASSASDDDYTYAWLDLAAVRWEQGNAVGSSAALAGAERLGWQRADVALAAGWLREQLGDQSAAIKDYGAAIANQPSLAEDSFWSTQPRQAEWPDILQAATNTAESHPGFFPDPTFTRISIMLFAGQIDAAQALATEASSPTRERANQVIAAWQGDTVAAAALARQANSGNNVFAQSWSATLAFHEGDLASARHFSALLAIDATGSGGGGVSFLHITLDDPSAAGIQSRLERYGSVYRRLLPPARIVGILPNLTPSSP